jgi:hypothetical protein
MLPHKSGLNVPSERFIEIPTLSGEERHSSERWESVRRDISHRLRGVCANLAPAEFITLVDSMVATQLRGEHRKNHSFRVR